MRIVSTQIMKYYRNGSRVLKAEITFIMCRSTISVKIIFFLFMNKNFENKYSLSSKMTVVANSFVGVGKWHLINMTYASTIELYFFDRYQVIHWPWIFIRIIEFHSQSVKTLYKPFSRRFSFFSPLSIALYSERLLSQLHLIKKPTLNGLRL